MEIIELILRDHPDIFAFVRNHGNEKLLVINNFYGKDTEFKLPETVDVSGMTGSILLSNYPDSSDHFTKCTLRPYESIVYHLKIKWGIKYGEEILIDLSRNCQSNPSGEI